MVEKEKVREAVTETAVDTYEKIKSGKWKKEDFIDFMTEIAEQEMKQIEKTTGQCEELLKEAYETVTKVVEIARKTALETTEKLQEECRFRDLVYGFRIVRIKDRYGQYRNIARIYYNGRLYRVGLGKTLNKIEVEKKILTFCKKRGLTDLLKNK